MELKSIEMKDCQGLEVRRIWAHEGKVGAVWQQGNGLLLPPQRKIGDLGIRKR